MLLFGFLMTGRMPELCLSDTSLLMTVMTTALTAVWLTVLAAGVYVYRRNKELFSANIVILAVLLFLILILFFCPIADFMDSFGDGQSGDVSAGFVPGLSGDERCGFPDGESGTKRGGRRRNGGCNASGGAGAYPF